MSSPRQKPPPRPAFSALALTTALSTPLTNRPESSVENRFASATASLIATAAGVSGQQLSSNVAISKSNRSIVGKRSIAQPSKSGLTIRSASSAYPSVPIASSSTNARCSSLRPFADDLAHRVVWFAIADDDRVQDLQRLLAAEAARAHRAFGDAGCALAVGKHMRGNEFDVVAAGAELARCENLQAERRSSCSTPSTSVSRSARSIRAIATSRVSPNATILAIIES